MRNNMNEAVIVDAVRTPIGKGNIQTGIYRDTFADVLGAYSVKGILERNMLDPRIIDDIIIGCVKQQEEQGFNIARQIALQAGIPIEIPSMTINRVCGSGLEAINLAALSIMAGYGDVYIAGGVEHMGHIPMDKDLSFNPSLFKHFSKDIINMGRTAELLTVKYNISREEQDEFAYYSHQKSIAAQQKCLFDTEIIPCYGRNERGIKSLIKQDQGVREDCTITSLKNLSPVFKIDGTITAGNASQISDGSSCLLVMSLKKSQELKMKPIVKVKSIAVSGVEPSMFGIGSVKAIEKILNKCSLSLKDIDVFEINEAFAVQVLAVIKELNIPIEKINLHGGAIALGHPLGCSGARITTTLLNIMRNNNYKRGIATMCIGLGQGIATLFELL